jgi:hypothetical protein
MNPAAAFERKLGREYRESRVATTISGRSDLLNAARKEAKSKGLSLSHHMEGMIREKLGIEDERDDDEICEIAAYLGMSKRKARNLAQRVGMERFRLMFAPPD